ncbi:MAG TPA: plastocyanin/azurin family copper-binding protein [archaeon]|nr:plastocyanin/azurin family copper-binding protein [archaeon]
MVQKYAYAIFALLAVALVAGCTSTGNVVAQGTAVDSVKEFSMDSFYVMENGKPHPQFSLNNIEVNKGDTVRIYVNVINGTHNFNIDEFNVQSETPTGEVTVIEFVADKSGEFVYYCSKPGHRANGHWGTLKVN